MCYNHTYEETSTVVNTRRNKWKKHEEITKRLQDSKQLRYWAGDNISDFINEGEKEQLIEEATEAV